ncbi:Cytidylate kinase [Alphaproteobacteria bacterium]
MDNISVFKKKVVICIDGPAASGKGTVAKKIARVLDFTYFSTGLVYRYLAYLAITKSIFLEDIDALAALAKSIDSSALYNIAIQLLYDADVTKASSIVAVHQEVRESLVDLQRSYVHSDKKNGAVVDGRDVGTVIFPDANCKFFLTAELKVRASRRFKQLQSQYKGIIYDKVLDELRERDWRDSNRQVAPLQQAFDALVVDTTSLSEDEVVELVVGRIGMKLGLVAEGI